MISFTALLEKFDNHGAPAERGVAGWTYVTIPSDVHNALMPDRKTSFRVRGQLDSHPIEQTALIPMGQTDGWAGQFVLIVNADMRRAIGKEAGATVRINLSVDTSPLPESADLLLCLADEPAAEAYFNTLPPSGRTYYHKWILDAKTATTRAKRIGMAVAGLALGLNYGDMIRYTKNRN